MTAPRVRCPVRGCDESLARAERTWRCPRGHAFDVARSGYVNLLQPADRRSAVPGDSRAAVEARVRLEERGLDAARADALAAFVRGLAPRAGAAALDVGAGTGGLLARLVAQHGLEGWAVDLSTRACELGARRYPELGWIVANADRTLPFSDGCFELVLSAVGPKHAPELHRLVRPGGTLVLVLSAADDLVELRAAAQGEGRLLERVEPTLERFAPWFTCVARATSRTRIACDRATLEDLLAATYRGARARERERLATVDALDVTLAYELLRLEPRSRPLTSPGRRSAEPRG